MSPPVALLRRPRLSALRSGTAAALATRNLKVFEDKGGVNRIAMLFQHAPKDGDASRPNAFASWPNAFAGRQHFAHDCQAAREAFASFGHGVWAKSRTTATATTTTTATTTQRQALPTRGELQAGTTSVHMF